MNPLPLEPIAQMVVKFTVYNNRIIYKDIIICKIYVNIVIKNLKIMVPY